MHLPFRGGIAALLAISALAITPVSAQAVGVTQVTMTPSFYPIYKDGFKDAAYIAFTSDDAADVRLTVKNSANRTVYSVGYGNKGAGRITLRWNGRMASGSVLPTGIYTLWVILKGTSGTKTFSRQTTIATGWQTHTGSASRSGSEGDANIRGNCFIEAADNPDYETIDCWNGQADVKFGFSVPAGATVTPHATWNTTSSDIQSGDSGNISIRGALVNPRWYVITAHVGDWRAIELDTVGVTWSYRTRI